VKHQTPGVKFIFFTILLDAIGLGLLIPVLPDVMRRFVSDPVTVSQYFGYFIGIYALMQFFAAPVLGTLSDKYGRRPILLVSLLGAGIDYLFMAFAPTLFLLFIGRMISGLTSASMTVASSYIVDVSNKKNRAANFGMIGAGWGIGFILGPLLGGLLGSLGYAGPFMAAAVLNLLNFFYGLFVLPESLPPKRRRKIFLKNINPLLSVFNVLKPSLFAVLIWIYLLLFLAGQVHPVNWTLYTETKFGWTAWQVGLSLAWVGVVMAFCQVFITRTLVPKLGDNRSLGLGLLVYVIGFLMFGMVPQGWMMYLVMVFFGLSVIAVPALQSVLAKYVPSNQQGELQGSLISLGSFSLILAPIIYTYLFVSFTKPTAAIYFPGAAYVAASLICVLALLVWFIFKIEHHE
jgi:DHA1 family tetracycline resistance protein-like MFS transporter